MKTAIDIAFVQKHFINNVSALWNRSRVVYRRRQSEESHDRIQSPKSKHLMWQMICACSLESSRTMSKQTWNSCGEKQIYVFTNDHERIRVSQLQEFIITAVFFCNHFCTFYTFPMFSRKQMKSRVAHERDKTLGLVVVLEKIQNHLLLKRGTGNYK